MNNINKNINLLSWVYKIGFLIILALPALIVPPYFFPADWGKSIVFRTVLSILLVIFCYQVFYKRDTIPAISIKNNKLIWALGAYFTVYLLASIFSVDQNFSFWGSPFRGGGFINFGFCFAYAVLLYIFLKDKDWKKVWIFSFFIGLIVSGLALIQYYGLFSKLFVPSSQPPSTMGNSIVVAMYFILLSFPALFFAITEPFDSAQGKIKKIFYITSLIIFLFTILISASLAGYIGITIGFLYFVLFYPKKLKILKVCLAIFLLCAISTVVYFNTPHQLPKILDNKITQKLTNKLSIKNALDDERFRAWQVMVKVIEDKPLLGWGPENLQIGFDKNYDSKITPTPWWDRAHNIFLNVGIEAGILGMLAQIALFIVLLWQLHKVKTIEAHGLQATIIGYLVAEFFSLDTLSTYLILFFIIGYTLYLTTNKTENPHKSVIIRLNQWTKSILISAIFLALIIFLFQYNLVPLQINGDINKAVTLSEQKNCTSALNLMDKNLLKHSFLDSYVRMEYIEIEKTCSEYYPNNMLEYTNKALEVLNEAVKIQPLYTRYWVNMGELTTTLADQEDDPTKKDTLINQANNYFAKALELAPLHQEIFTGLTELEIASGNYAKAKDYSQKCIDINPNTGDCYFYMAISEIYARNVTDGKINLQKAEDMGVNVASGKNVFLLSNAYGSIPDYQNMAVFLEKLVAIYADGVAFDIKNNRRINPTIVQYHSTLAFLYAKMGQYDKAHQEAAIVLQLSPESKESVDEFLKTLPY
ncbi:MAG: O-antigen ligase family protein [Candidatus Staskawiczbacteria bacterium]|nr:O-antigen ligase family protein [Candidatus Staskawiczbacteria bacterium]